jgi:hypothetical protein
LKYLKRAEIGSLPWAEIILSYQNCFLLPSCQLTAYTKVSVIWPDMAFCFMPGASHHHKDDVGCTGAPFWPNNIHTIIGYLSYRWGKIAFWKTFPNLIFHTHARIDHTTH